MIVFAPKVNGIIQKKLTVSRTFLTSFHLSFHSSLIIGQQRSFLVFVVTILKCTFLGLQKNACFFMQSDLLPVSIIKHFAYINKAYIIILSENIIHHVTSHFCLNILDKNGIQHPMQQDFDPRSLKASYVRIIATTANQNQIIFLL